MSVDHFSSCPVFTWPPQSQNFTQLLIFFRCKMNGDSYLKYDWHLTTKIDHQRRHDYYLAKLSEQNRIKKLVEAEKANKNSKKQELEKGFSAYVNGPHSAKKRVESRAKSRSQSRPGTGPSYSPEKTSPEKVSTRNRTHRKSWVDRQGSKRSIPNVSNLDFYLDLSDYLCGISSLNLRHIIFRI